MEDFLEMFGVEKDLAQEDFVNIHIHTDSSNSKQPDAVVPFKEYVRRAVELGHRCVSTCEHGSSGDLLEKFYWKDKCGKLYYTINGIEDFKAIYIDNPKYEAKAKAELETKGATNFRLEKYNLNIIFANEIYFKYDLEKRRGSHLLIIATDKESMEIVNEIASDVVKNRDGFWGIADLNKLPSDKIYISTACLASPTRQRDESDDHEKVFDFLYNKFGDHLLLEVQANSAPEQATWNKELAYKAQKYGLKLIAGCDSHYIYPEQYELRTILLGAKGITYEEEDTMILDYPDRNTLEDRFRKQGVLTENEITQAINNTLIFVEGTEGFEFNYDIKIPSVYKNPENEKKDFLNKMKEGYERLTEGKDEEKKKLYFSELQREISVVSKGGMIPFLMTAYSIIRLAQDGYINIEGRDYYLPKGMEKGLLTKTGRGSAGGSLCNYCLEFTTLDRLDSEVPLLFERFISLDRLEAKIMMDIDLNLSKQEPFEEASKILLGRENAYFMIKKDTLQEASAIKTVARYYNYNLEQQEDIVNNRSKYEKSGEYEKIYNYADQLIDVCIGISRHPCGMCLYDGDIEKSFGLLRFKDSSIGVPIVGSSIDIFKYLKLDFLVATTWTIIDNACKDAGIKVPSVKELSNIIYKEDSKVFKIVEDGMTATVCQLNTHNGKSKGMEFKPKSVAEISDLSAGMRPAFQSMIDTLLKRINFRYGVKELDDYLISSTGCKQAFMLYQEQAMEVLQMAGISLAEAYVVLKAISKKKEDVILSYKDRFIEGFANYIIELNKDEENEE